MRQIIKSFKIKNLFGDRDINIPFNNSIKILIGENGLGKTTVLNILYYTLTAKFFKLKSFDFESLEIKFSDDQKIIIKKEEILHDEIKDDIVPPLSLLEKLSRILSPIEIAEIALLFKQGLPNGYILDTVYNKQEIHRGEFLHRYPSRLVLSALKSICGFNTKNPELKKAREILTEKIKDTTILYFPTFRRIEEDLINLGITDDKPGTTDTRLIQFGMKDVKERLESIKREINFLSSKGLSQISSEILSQLLKGVPQINNRDLNDIKIKDIEIILSRVGAAISKDDKKKILKIVEDRKFKNSDDKYLLYFLKQLVNIYEEQRDIDNSIENFIKVCNHYLFPQSLVSSRVTFII